MGLFGKEKNAGEWNDKGETLFKEGKYDKAITCFDKAIMLEPKYVEAWSNKSVPLMQKWESDKAIACCDEAIRLEPKYANAWCNKAAILQQLQCYDEAIACYDEVIKFEPKHAKSWNDKGQALYRLKRKEAAIACFDEAIRLEPNNLLWQKTKIECVGRNTFHIQKKIIVRKGWTELEKEEVRIRQDGKCAICQKPPPRWEYDHIDGNRSNDILSNCQGLCPNCHSVKTNEE
jgi:tetratricopeptide (TPR) repeat protein